MKKLLIVLLLVDVAISIPTQCFANENCTEQIKGFLTILANKPTLDICEKLVLSESELILERIICEQRGWGPKESGEIEPRCVAFTNRRAKRGDNPCLYLMWLRSKIPTSPTTFKVLTHQYVKEYKHQRVTVLLATTTVEFVISDPDTYGGIDVRRINGEDVFDILERDVKEGFSPSIYLEEESRVP